MKHYGDVNKINGAEVEPVDIITFGSPCQDLSVAGKRAGIQDGERSNLFFEAIRIIKEMREVTNDEYPKYAVWENVPGAFSSNKGHDFHAVLEALCSVCDDTVSIPKPCDAKQTDKLVWNKAGEVVGNNYSIAWRTLDAQYWGVPQRRKRIYLVADFTGRRAGEILFKPDSLRGNLPQGNETGQGATVDVVGSVDGSNGNGGQLAATLISSYGTKWNGNAGAYNGENFVLQKHSVDGSVGAAGVVSKGNGDCFIMPERHMSLSVGGGQAGQGYPCVLHESVGVECIGFAADKASTLRAGAGAPKHMADILGRLVVLNDQGGSSINVEGETLSPTLRANSHQHEPVIALQANGIDRADTAGCNGCGWRENESYTLNTVDRHAVCYQEQVGALQARDYKGVGSQYVGEDKLVVECYDARGNGDRETACTITGDHQNRITDYTAVAVQQSKPPRRYIIRRLTPTECARLQGFPDWWSELAPYNPDDAEFWEEVRKTDLEIRGKKHRPVKSIEKWYEKLHTDSAEYKAYGNGLALPCAEFVIRGIAEVLRNEKGQFASKGGVIEHKGYTCIYKPEHPRAKANGYVREHILVAEEMLGRPLDGEEVVHHINGDKADNRPENLEIFPNHAEHVRHHNRTDGKKYSYNGGEFTVAELSEFSVVDYSVLTQRINKLGWDIKRAVETPKRGQPTLGSLFDGIGGFPLAGVLNGIKPIWASEVALYPIAVTKSRFKEAPNG